MLYSDKNIGDIKKKVLHGTINILKEFPTNLEHALMYVSTITKILVNFILNMLKAIKPVTDIVTQTLYNWLSYKSLMKIAINMGIISKLTLTIATITNWYISPFILQMMSEYLTMCNIGIVSIQQNIKSIKEQLGHLKEEILQNGLLKEETLRLQRLIEENTITEKKKESELEAEIASLQSSLEDQKEKVTRVTAINELNQLELSKQKQTTNTHNTSTVIHALTTTLNAVLILNTLYNKLAGTANSDDSVILLQTIKATLEEGQKNNIRATANERAKGEKPQLTADSGITSLDDI